MTPLHIATKLAKVDCLEVLIKKGANVNSRCNQQNTALHLIASSKKGRREEKERCAEMLVNAGTDIRAENEEGKTILDFEFFQDLKDRRPDLFLF
jgi:ankyrin repeat protein